MELSKNFLPNETDAKWYQHWLDKGYFNSTPDEREPYTIVIPPPNVTGVLHMGHCLNNTIQDILIRRARMQGKNACWVPGTDHASIATEAKVVAMLRERGIAKSSLSRDEFLQYAWEWKEKYGGIILQQLKKLGCSLDWNRVNFTMDDDYYKSVIGVFVDLYNKGYIYRGKRMINWDTKAKTALSDEEVIRKETNQKLYYLKYAVVDSSSMTDDSPASKVHLSSNNHITIATVRPETIMGDTAICVNPNDERYKHLHGKFAVVPLINRRIPIITDDYVTMDFGTGALKVTPAHDMNDNQLGQKHNLEVVDILHEDGTLNEAAQIYIGEDRFAARKKIVIELEEKGYLLKTEDYTSEVGYSERTDTVVEPRLSLQWWVSMKKLSEPALKAVMEDDIKFHPVKFKNLYRHWMENVKDWCISRQLWWGHRIPAWYDEQGNYYVAATEQEAKQQAAAKNSAFNIQHSALTQDEDCLDTWFSSWLWPFEVFKGYSKPGNAEVKYYYPTNTLVTAPEIIFFWVARMIIAGEEYMGQKPFNDVYFTGIVRDKMGRKMSKSLGNSPDLLGLIDTYGADAVRFGIMVSSPAGNDLMFDEASLEQGRNFNNKLWNALKLVKTVWTVAESLDSTPAFYSEGERPMTSNWIPQPERSVFAIDWFANRLNQVKNEIEYLFREFKLSEALRALYLLIWDDFCSYYLEWIKPDFQQPIDHETHEKTLDFFEELMLLLHPFMPFITEEIHHNLRNTDQDLCVMQSSYALQLNELKLKQGEFAKRLINLIRNQRIEDSIKNSEQITVYVFADLDEQVFVKGFQKVVEKSVNARFEYENGLELSKKYHRYSINKIEFCIEKRISNLEEYRSKLIADLEHQQNFLQSVMKKLSNEKFVQNAKPEVLAMEQKKKADAEARIKTIEESLAALN